MVSHGIEHVEHLVFNQEGSHVFTGDSRRSEAIPPASAYTAAMTILKIKAFP